MYQSMQIVMQRAVMGLLMTYASQIAVPALHKAVSRQAAAMHCLMLHSSPVCFPTTHLNSVAYTTSLQWNQIVCGDCIAAS